MHAWGGGGILIDLKGGNRSLLAVDTVLESTAGMLLRIQSDINVYSVRSILTFFFYFFFFVDVHVMF